MRTRLLTLVSVLLVLWIAETAAMRAAHMLAETGRAIAGEAKR